MASSSDSMSKVSVIVPIYKTEQYIERCARSLFGQTMQDVEYIFVDDCSPDNSLVVLERVINEFPHRKPMVKIHRNERNLGAAGAKNVGMRLATGDFLMFADSDDWLDHNGIEQMYRFATKNRLDIAYCNFYGGFGRAQDAEAREPECRDYIEGLRLMLLGKLQGSMCTRIFRREFILKTDEWLIEGANVFEDLGWCIRLYTHRPKVGYAPLCFYHYFMDNGESVMHTISKKKKELPDVYVNLSRAVSVIEKQGLANTLEHELLFAKARAKESFLCADISHLRRWRYTYPEANELAMALPTSQSVRIAKWFLTKGFYLPMLVRLWMFNVKNILR